MALTEQDVRRVIASIGDAAEAETMDASADFQDCGLDSLDRVNLILHLEDMYGLRIADGDFEQCRSIAAIVAYFAQPAAA